MRRLFLATLTAVLVLSPGGPVCAKEPEVSVSLDKDEVVLGDFVRLRITVEGKTPQSAPDLPEIPDFGVRYLGSRSESFTSVTVIVQGKKIEEKRSGGGVTYEYALTPKRTGTFAIPPFSFLVDGERFRTSGPYVITVTDAPSRREDLFIRVTADKETLYLGESALLTFEWYFDKNLEDYTLQIPWYGALKDFLVEEPKPDPNKEYVRMIVNDGEKVTAEKKTVTFRGKKYGVLSFHRILTPISTGSYTFDPAFLRAVVVTGYREPRRARFFFKGYFDWMFEDDPFGRQSVTETVVARSEPVTLTVKSLPKAGRPEQFTGAVGQFDFQVTAEPETVRVGEPVTVTMKVVGSGNFNEIRLPEFPELSAFKGYAPEIRTDTSRADGMLIGEKVFGKVLVGRREGTYEIPPLSFHYFDTESESYRTITRGPFTIRVTPGEAETGAPPVYTPSPAPERRGREVKVITRDIRYIKSELGEVRRETRSVYERGGFWAFGLAPLPLLALGAFWVRKRRMRFQSDVGYARSRQAFKKAQRGIADCERSVKEGKTGDFYSGISSTLNHFLGDKLNRPPGSMAAEMTDALKERRIDPALLEELKAVLEKIDLAKYSLAGGNREEMQTVLERVKTLLNRLERVL